jgi:probable HAF family extracellular repeat protein
MVFVDFFRGTPIMSRNRDGGNPPGRRARLTLEALEDRTLLNYSITDLGTFGGTYSAAYAINNRGQVVGGAYLACQCAVDPFLWAGGSLHDLGSLGGATSNWAFGINDLGQVVGTSSHAFLWSRETGMTDLGFAGDARKVNNRTEVVGQTYVPAHAFLWSDGILRDLGTLYGGGSVASGLNNLGQVVGQASARAFLWTEQAGMKDLGSLNGSVGTSGASAINDLGQIVGSSYSNAFNTTHATYFSRSGPLDLGTLGGFSDAHALNNRGQVVGDSFTSDGDHAFLTDLNGGPMVDLNTLLPPDSGWVRLSSADGINDAGQIVGTGQLPGYDNVHAYLLTPEDSSVAPFVTAAPESPKIPGGAAGGAFQGWSPDPSPAQQSAENGGRWRAPSEEPLVPRPVSVLDGLAFVGAPAPPSAGPLSDALAPQDPAGAGSQHPT